MLFVGRHEAKCVFPNSEKVVYIFFTDLLFIHFSKNADMLEICQTQISSRTDLTQHEMTVEYSFLFLTA